jgi:hypothetical protein
MTAMFSAAAGSFICHPSSRDMRLALLRSSAGRQLYLDPAALSTVEGLVGALDVEDLLQLIFTVRFVFIASPIG